MDYEFKQSNGTSGGPLLSSTDNSNENENKLPSNLDFSDFDNDNQLKLSNTNITTTVNTSNGKRSADELDDDDDLGPETDVDTLDEIMMSPKDVKEDYQFESKEICDEQQLQLQQQTQNQKSDIKFDSTNPFGDVHIGGDNLDNINPFDDNKLRDLIEVDETKVTSELVDEIFKKDILSEKRDNSFEKDEFENDNVSSENIRYDGLLLETVAEGNEINDICNKGEELMESINSQGKCSTSLI